MLRRSVTVLLATAAATPLFGQQIAPSSDLFARLRLFVGSWRDDQSGQPGKGVSERTYEFVLNDRFLQVKNTSTYPPQEKNKNGEVHHDVGMIGMTALEKGSCSGNFTRKAS